MSRFEIGQIIVGVHFPSSHKSLHGYRPAMVFDQVEPQVINLYQLEVLSVHKVGLGHSGTVKPYDGFVLRDIERKKTWFNQYPYATGTPPNNLHEQMFTRDLTDLRGKDYAKALEEENIAPYRCENVLSYMEQLNYLISKGGSNGSDVSELVRFAGRMEKELETIGYRLERAQSVDNNKKKIPHHFQFELIKLDR